jgi:large subunit ribosomal protein L6
MSRIGSKAVAIPDGVDAKIEGQSVSVKGPKGELSMVLVDEVSVQMTDDGIKVDPRDQSKTARSMWGMQRTLVSNIVVGVTEGFTRTLDINGVGYRAQMQGNNLQLALGLSHDVVYPAPDGIKIETPTQTQIIISGIDKQRVGQVAAEIRRFRPPEPYKGKGVRYTGERIRTKAGKAGAKS